MGRSQDNEAQSVEMVSAGGWHDGGAAIEICRKQRIRQHRGTVMRVCSILLCDILACSLLWTVINANDFAWRVYSEFQNSLFSRVCLTTGEYTGETDFGYFTGNGAFAYKSGASYTGTWDANELEGVGVFNDPSSGTYKGSYSDSRKNGKGTFTWTDGDKYTGEWREDQLSGEGEYVSSGGAVYRGIFKSNVFIKGVCTFKSGHDSCSIVYKDGKLNQLEVAYSDGSSYKGAVSSAGIDGKGEMKYARGDSFSGMYADGKREGNGVYIWADGCKYEGGWKKDAMDGDGVFTFANGDVAKGVFSQNRFVEGTYEVNNSDGKYIFCIEDSKASSVSISLADGTICSGSVEDGKLAGQVQIKYGNGDEYLGAVDGGMKSGTGTYTWASGASYQGAWQDDKMNGPGTYTFPAGQVGNKIVGSFVDGYPDGQCQYYADAIKQYKTDWQGGRCVKVYE